MTREITRVQINAGVPSLVKQKRVCAYVRVSTEHNAQLESLQNQAAYYARKIWSQPDYEYVGIFSDAGISGAKVNRPGFAAMMNEARQGKINLILTKSISRFARNTVFLLESIRELKGLGVAVEFEQEKINTLTTDGEFLLSILASFAEEERRSVSANVRMAIRNKFKQGISANTTDSLFGFGKNKAGEVIILEKEARIVRDIYKWYLAGILPEHIAKRLNDAGVPTRRPGAIWRHIQIRHMLSNEKYVGDCYFQKSFTTDDGKTHENRGELPMYFVKNHHPRIISRRGWNKVQQIKASRKQKVWPFSLMLICWRCGAYLTRNIRSHDGLVVWLCSTYINKLKSTCPGTRVLESVLDDLTKGMMPLKEPMVVEEETDDKINIRQRPANRFRLIPKSQYEWKGNPGEIQAPGCRLLPSVDQL